MQHFDAGIESVLVKKYSHSESFNTTTYHSHREACQLEQAGTVDFRFGILPIMPVSSAQHFHAANCISPTGAHILTTADIDECSNAESCSGLHEKCVNLPGSYECECQTDYIREGDVCVPKPKGETDGETALDRKSTRKSPLEHSPCPVCNSRLPPPSCAFWLMLIFLRGVEGKG